MGRSREEPVEGKRRRYATPYIAPPLNLAPSPSLITPSTPSRINGPPPLRPGQIPRCWFRIPCSHDLARKPLTWLSFADIAHFMTAAFATKYHSDWEIWH